MAGYNLAFDITAKQEVLQESEPILQMVQEVSPESRDRPPVEPRKKPKSSVTPVGLSYLRNFPKELLGSVRGMFPELDNQTDAMIAFVLCHMGVNTDENLPSYRAPKHIKDAVKRVLGSDETGIQAIGVGIQQLQKKLNGMNDEILKAQMLIAYNVTVQTGLHAPGRVSRGDDLKLAHERVIETTYAMLDEFPQYKQIVTDRQGRPARKKGV